jgi:hypothetical protein
LHPLFFWVFVTGEIVAGHFRAAIRRRREEVRIDER